jgi:hypothetical protein
MLKKLIFALFCCIFAANFAAAQHRTTNTAAAVSKPDSAMVDFLTMRDGTELVGFVKGMNADMVTFLPLNGGTEMMIQRSLVKATRSMTYKDYASGYLSEHRGAPSLFAAHTGFMIPKGEGRYETMGFVVSNMYDYAITKNVMVGGGLFAFLPTFRVKVGGQVAPNIHLAAGTTIASLPFVGVDFAGGSGAGGGGNFFFGSTYGVATFGNPNNFVNVSGGVAYGASPLGAIATVQVGGFSRFSAKTAFFGELNFLPDALYAPTNSNSLKLDRRAFILGNVGLRFMQKTTSWDLGMCGMSSPGSVSQVIFFPMVGFKAYVGGGK